MSIDLLVQAARFGDYEVAKLLIKRGVDVNALVTHVGRHHRTDKNPLHWASEYGHAEIVKVLLEAGAEVNTPDTLYDEDDPYNDRTSLHYAAYYGHKNVAKLLIDNGADINAKDREWDTPLHLAAEKGNTELARLLIDKGADVNAKYKNDVNGALNQVVSYSGFSVRHTEKYGSSPLHRAADAGYTELAGLLIDKGADVKAKDDMFKTPLDLAEKSGHKNTVKLLTEWS
tara:strand:+ start:176 stop:862 length:687 start_codon:yes stop_codon:yes gene_type:complete